MLNLKKTAVAVLAFGSSAVFAGSMGPVCTPGSVTVPCERTAWDFAGQALYLQPVYSGAGYLGALEDAAGNESYQDGTPHWGWGFKLEGSYHFYTVNDLNLNWYHLNNTTNSSFSNSDSFFTPVGHENENPGVISGSLDTKWDAVNLEFGQHVDFGDRKKIRFHGGVQYARVNLTGDVDMPNNPLLTVPGVTPEAGTGEAFAPTDLEQDITYNGFGPRAGMDMAYHWGNGFAMYANSAMALLIGTSKFNNSVTGQSPDFLVFNGNGSTTKFVPELEAKLGATYTYAMAQGDLSLDVGWMWNNYFSVLDTGTGAGTTKSSDFAVQGPFIGLKWLGNVA